MNDRLKTIVDLKKYPIHDLNSPIIKNLVKKCKEELDQYSCLLYTSPSPRDATLSRMPSSA